jgi:hypothetical protein
MGVQTTGDYRIATITTKANLTDVTNPSSPIAMGGNLNLTLVTYDHLTIGGGQMDKISVSLSGGLSVNTTGISCPGTNNLLFSSFFSGGATVPQVLSGGNVNITVGNTSAQANLITANAMMETNREVSAFNVKAFPNPTEHQFTLYLEGASNEKIQVVVYDAIGRQVKKIERGDASGAIKFGEELKTGAYIVEVRQGVNRKTLKLVKQ